MWLLAFLVGCDESAVPCRSSLGPADADCDGLDDRDADGDGAESAAVGGPDCDDADPALNPLDADADGASTCAGDCDDARADVGPRGVTPETCDDVDNDCNGVVDVDDLGVPACLVVDAYEQPARLRLDLLVVVDDTGSMLDEEGRLAAVADAVFAHLDGTDTHVGVITNDAEDLALAGRLRAPIGGGDRFLNVLDDTPDETRIWWRGATAVGAAGQHPDAGFDAAFTAIAVHGDGFNAGFYRDDADLAVWFVSDSNDNSEALTLLEFADWLRGLKLGSGRSVHVDGIIPVSSDPCSTSALGTESYEDLVTEMQGLSLSVCLPDWTDAGTLAAARAPITQIVEELSQIPIPATLTADVHTTGGQLVSLPASALVYDPFDNLVSVPGFVWTEVEAVEIRYEVLPP